MSSLPACAISLLSNLMSGNQRESKHQQQTWSEIRGTHWWRCWVATHAQLSRKQLNTSAQCCLYTGRNHGSSDLITNTSLQMLPNYRFHWADGCQQGSRLWTRSQPISHSDTRLWSPSRGEVHKNLQAFDCGINAVTRFQRNLRCDRSHDTPSRSSHHAFWSLLYYSIPDGLL